MVRHRELAVLTFPSEDRATEALARIGELGAVGAVLPVEAARVSRAEDGTLQIAERWRIGRGAALLPRVLEAVSRSDDGAHEETRARGMSESFVDELHDVVTTSPVSLAYVASRLEVGAVVAAFLGFRGTRLVHGWFAADDADRRDEPDEAAASDLDRGRDHRRLIGGARRRSG